jgi:preprotein translocase subunit SecY
VVYLILIVVFAYFYTSITFNPIEIANNLRRQSGVIPGVNPGRPTSEYLDRILNYIVLIGAVLLMVVALVPILCSGLFNASVSFGGTSLIIVVGVVLETIKQIESMMARRYYKGFLSE